MGWGGYIHEVASKGMEALVSNKFGLELLLLHLP